MRTVRALLLRLAGLFRRDRNRDFAEEMEAHLQMQIEDNIRSGMTPEQARRDALVKSGGLDCAEEACRDRRGIPLLEDAIRDLRHGMRVLRRAPAATALCIVSLALGIGATAIIFSVQKATVLAPLPYPEPDRLVVVWQRPPERREAKQPLTSPDYFDYRERNTSFQELGVQSLPWLDLSGGTSPERVQGSRCTASFLRAVGVTPALGRLFTDEEEQQQVSVVVLSDGLWKRRFGGDPRVIGQRISVNREPFTVVGVMPAGYQSPRIWAEDASAELWVPARLSRSDNQRSTHRLVSLGRLKPGVSLATAEADIQAIAAANAKLYPTYSARVGAWLVPLQELMVRPIRNSIWLLFAAVGGLLLISCANVASIQFARTNGRQAEVAIRASLGAGRMRVASQFLTENLLLSAVGGAIGVVLAFMGLGLMRGMLPATMERAAEIRVDGWVLLFALGITALTGILSGLAPAFCAARSDLNSALRLGGGTLTAGRRRTRFQSALVIGQFAIALILLNGAGLMLKSYSNVIASAGLDGEHVLVAGIALNGADYKENAEARTGFWIQLMERVRAIPGVQQAAMTSKLPFEGGSNSSYLVEDEQYSPKADRTSIEESYVTPEYLDAMGIPLLTGRLFAPGTKEAGGGAEILVNRAFARRYWPKGSALGKRVYRNNLERTWVGEIVGVVEDVRQWGVEKPPAPEIYFPLEGGKWADRTLVVRTSVPALTLAGAVRSAVTSLDPEQPLSKMRTMELVRDGATAQRRFNTRLIEIFAGLSLLMVLVGVYGVISCWVTQRAREVGVRMALGAGRGRIAKMVVGRALLISAAGIALGLAGSFGVSRLVQSMLYGVSPTNPLTIVCVAFVLLLIAIFAAAQPALRAARIDPARTLRAG